MAQVRSGSFKTTGYSSNYVDHYIFEWELKSQSIEGNYSIIEWKLYGAGGNSSESYTYVKQKYVTVNGETKSNETLQKTFNGTTPFSGTSTIYHDNTTGKATFSASAGGAFYTYGAYNSTGSGEWELPTIPRYATSNQSLNSKTETTIKINWSSDSIVDYIWYSTNDGYSWTGIDVTDGKSGTYTISGLSSNTLYNVRTRVRRKDSQLTTDSSRLQVTTYYYPHCVITPDFVIGEPLTLTLYNPLSRLVTINFIGANGESLSTDTTTSTTVTGYNTDNFKSKLYATIPNATSGMYQIKVTYDGVTETRSTGNKYTVNVNECIPTFNDFSYSDINTAVTNVTGNNQVLVKGLSNLQVTISSANKMIAKNSASGNKYIAIIDSLNKSVAYSDSDTSLVLGTVLNSGTKRLTVNAYDSRNIPKEVYKDIIVYDYIKPVVNIDLTRLNNFEDQTTLKVNGTYTRLTIDGTDKNSITSVQYRYRETGGAWSSWTSITTTVTSGKFTCSDIILSLDNTKSFEFEVQAVDRLDNNSNTAMVDIGEAIFFISSNKKKCYANGIDIMAGINYSNEEQVIGSWIDGREIYKKTFIVDALSNSGLLKVTHNISNLDIILDIKGVATNSSNFLPLPYLTSDSTTDITIYANATEIRISSGNDRSSYRAYVTLFYIKKD